MDASLWGLQQSMHALIEHSSNATCTSASPLVCNIMTNAALGTTTQHAMSEMAGNGEWPEARAIVHKIDELLYVIDNWDPNVVGVT